jgi:hypothetical protein
MGLVAALADRLTITLILLLQKNYVGSISFVRFYMDLGGEEDGGNLEVDENIVPRCD